MDVEVEASGFTRDMSDSFDEVWLGKDQTDTGWEGRERPGKLTLFLHIPSSTLSVDAMKYHPHFLKGWTGCMKREAMDRPS